MTKIDPKLLIAVGALGAIGGFLLIEDYRVGAAWGVVANAMTGLLPGGIPYRYVLLCSLLLIGFGLYGLWARPKN